MEVGEEKTERQLANEAKRLAKLEKFKAKQEKQTKEKAENTLKAKESKPAKKTMEEVPIPVTPEGQKKDTFLPMASTYSPRAVEEGWYGYWEKQGYFKPEVILEKNPDAPTFTIPIPPPNVTGSLHLGHAMGLSIQDCLIRWKRMNGCAALFLPGCDHAGISCQVVVEKNLWKIKKLTRHDLGRAEFLKQVWQWKDQYGNRIYEQFKKIGASLDWSRVTFTLDDKFNKAVENSFIKFFEDGVIYRDNRLVNWSGKLQTTVSDLEVDHLEVPGKTLMKVYGHDDKKDYVFGQIYDVAYLVLDDKGNPTGNEIVISTTRPETIPADVAVAIDGQDPRYKQFHGSSLRNPLTGTAIPLIIDSIADMNFGTGAVKITPAHDTNDFQVGLRHGLQMKNILTDDNHITSDCGVAELTGLMRFDARQVSLDLLTSRGLLRDVKDHAMILPICNRSGDIIEPRLRPQWWLKCSDMAKRSADAIRNGDLALLPSESEKIWYNWLDNPKDWCLSRQLWWGHQIPAYEVFYKGRSVGWQAGSSTHDVYERLVCKGVLPSGASMSDCEIVQDPDVFDTWYSAALWPLVTLGWTGTASDLSGCTHPDYLKYFPTSLLETGRDIIFFWVARMTMFSLYFTNKVPFTTVFLHSIVRDAHGRKMSKSLGNVIDPLDVIHGISLASLQTQLLEGNLDTKEIEAARRGQLLDFPNGIAECGTDALRFALCAYTSPGSDVNLDIGRVEGYRKFCNKIWNATKFVLSRLETLENPQEVLSTSVNIDQQSITDHSELFTRWIFERLQATIASTNTYLETYHFQKATSTLHAFFLYDFCDVYIEVSKRQTSSSVYHALFTVLVTYLKLLHPFMPYLTEELYHHVYQAVNLPLPYDSISLDSYPTTIIKEPETLATTPTSTSVEYLLEVVKNIRILSKDIKSPFKVTLKHVNVNGMNPISEIINGTNKLALLNSSKECLCSLVKNLKELYIMIDGATGASVGNVTNTDTTIDDLALHFDRL